MSFEEFAENRPRVEARLGLHMFALFGRKVVSKGLDMAEDCLKALQEFGSLYVRHFHPGLCAKCLKSPYHVKLKHCAQCQLVSYCSKCCQKSDWKSHRQFCLANAVKCGKNVFSEAKTKVTSFRIWTQFRTSLVDAVSVKHDLEQNEREALWFPKVCEICKDSDLSKLFPCTVCNSIFYCSKEHLEQDIDEHRHWCGRYLTCVSVDHLFCTAEEFGRGRWFFIFIT
ncbi:uncharacterized protein LOC135217535 [Macrobrachium nipponense]|uniref:uncharacterized protein LOC135217535 n=1 Tax=Macrobrachium nipponense TaxID=159736 RepID=UPI0030C81E29